MVVPHEHTPESSTNAFKQMMAKKKAEAVVKEDDMVITERTFGKYSQSEYFELVKGLYGHIAPGMVLGGIMVDMALKNMPQDVEFGALLETTKCLPDAVQFLTNCSVGNGKIRFVDTGKYAVTLFDRTNGKGVRAFVDCKNLEKFPEMNNWMMRKADKKAMNHEALLKEMIAEAHHVLSILPVEVADCYYKKAKSSEVIMCPLCFEPFPADKGDKCAFCRGDSPFESFG